MKTIVTLSFSILFAALCSLPLAQKSEKHRQKFVLVGGGTIPDSVRKQFVNLAGGKDAHLVIIPSASEKADYPLLYKGMWVEENVASIDVLHAHSREEAGSPSFYDHIRYATGVWISGGDQARLIDLYGGTPVVRELRALLQRGGVVGGTSAGASIVGKIMPYTDGEMTGFGLLDHFIIDQHFKNRHREERLKRLVGHHPGMLGVGIDESTAIIIDDATVTVLGEGTVNLIGG